MIRMFVRHNVGAYGKWRKVYDAFDEERRSMGVEGAAVFQSAGEPTDVTLWHDFANLKAAKAFAASPRLKAIMRDAGVKGAPKIWFTKHTR